MKMRTEFWEGHVAAAKRETISASEYARRHGISVAALYYWQHKCRRDAPAVTSSKVSKLAKPAHASKFVALRVLDKQVMAPCLCTLVLSSDLRLEMSALPEPSWLAALGYAIQGTR
jgi:transposase-like protein